MEYKPISKEKPSNEDNLESKILPLGAQFLELLDSDSPGKVYDWNWKPEIEIYVSPKDASSWPGTTGTGPGANSDERYGENG